MNSLCRCEHRTEANLRNRWPSANYIWNVEEGLVLPPPWGEAGEGGSSGKSKTKQSFPAWLRPPLRKDLVGRCEKDFMEQPKFLSCLQKDMKTLWREIREYSSWWEKKTLTLRRRTCHGFVAVRWLITPPSGPGVHIRVDRPLLNWNWPNKEMVTVRVMADQLTQVFVVLWCLAR